MTMKKSYFILMFLVILALIIMSCKDFGDLIPQGPPAFTISQNPVDIAVGDSSTQTLSGGTPPYSISTNSDATKAQATLNGSSLKVKGLAVGTTIIVIGDNGAPQKTVSLTVRVGAAPIRFSTQVQPIFNTRCVNPGCHPGGGAPFSLQASVSYANLVNVAATNAPCAGVLRVKSNDAANSALYRRIEGTCGSLMPLDGSGALPQAQRDLIRDWINQGALNN